MKLLKTTIGAAVFSGLLAATSLALAADSAKPYPLKTCVVSGEKLGGDMGKPYVFTHEGQEVQLCCKSCLKDFQKEPAKYLKKLTDAQNGTKAPTAGAAAHEHGMHQH